MLGPDSDTCKDDPDSVVVEYGDFVKVLEILLLSYLESNICSSLFLHICQVLRELSPSLSMAELNKYELLRDKFQGSS